MTAATPPFTAAAPRPGTDRIAGLLLQVRALPLQATVSQAADALLDPRHARLLCLPVVDDAGRAAGTISRHALNDIFLRRFGRELFGSRPVTVVMNHAPLRVAVDMPLEHAARDVAARLGAPVTEDFVIEDGGRYAGMGVVIDLMSALQHRVDDAFRQLQGSQAQLVQ